jgi:hypothetical protein
MLTVSDAVALAIENVRPQIAVPVTVSESWSDANRVVVFLSTRGEITGLGPVAVDRETGAIEYVASSTDPETVTRNMSKVQP